MISKFLPMNNISIDFVDESIFDNMDLEMDEANSCSKNSISD